MSPWRQKLHEVIYEADTPAGKLFDVILLIIIILSIVLVMLESVESINSRYAQLFDTLEWTITALFTAEYIARIIAVRRPLSYILSFYGIIDLISTLPKYLSLFFGGTQALLALRSLRLLRVFRVLKLTRYIGESQNLMAVLAASRRKISVFLFAITILCLILGTVMYLVESPESGFTSIPRSIYWAIVTLTTVGYGDIAPQTVLGQSIASAIMIMGYSIIAIPTGIVSAEMAKQDHSEYSSTQACPVCSAEHHRMSADYCWKCGSSLHLPSSPQEKS